MVNIGLYGLYGLYQMLYNNFQKLFCCEKNGQHCPHVSGLPEWPPAESSARYRNLSDETLRRRQIYVAF